MLFLPQITTVTPKRLFTPHHNAPNLKNRIMKNTLRSKNLPLVATGIPNPFCNPKTKTTSSLKGFFTLVMMVLGMGVSWGQISEGFESGLTSSYQTATLTFGSGQWAVTNTMYSTVTGVNGGSKCAQLQGATGSALITPTISGGVGTISFYVTASTTSGAYQVNISTNNGSTWSAVTGSPFTISTTKTLKTITVNNSAVNKIQIYRTGATIYIDDFSTTTASASLTPPTLTAAGSATVDGAFDVTFTDNPTWRAAAGTVVTIGGTVLTAGYAITAGIITFTPSTSVPVGLLQTAGASKVIVISKTGYSNATVSQTIGVGAATKLAISVQPTAPTTNGGALAQQPTVLIQDQYGNTTASTATVTATAVQGTWTAGGSNTKAGVAGSAAFSGLTATSAAAVTGATIAFSCGSLTSVTSSAFNIPAPPPANDLCASKVALTVNAAAIAGTSVLATQTVLSAEFETLTSDVWYSFTATATANATVTVLNGTSLDYDLFVYTPSCPTDGTTYISKASTATTTSESVTFAATLGVTYIIRVGQFGSGAGTSFTIGVTMPTSSTWNGTAWSNGAPTSSLDAIIAGNYSTTTNGVFSAKTLTVNSGKSFTINTGHNITVAGAVTNGGTLTISNNANLVQTDVAATNTGSITVNRNSANIQLYDYTLWSSPVASQQLQAFSPSTLATRFYTYNFTDNLYNVVSNPAGTTFNIAKGYLIRAPNTWTAGASAAPFSGTFTGVPNNGTIPVTLNYTDAARSYNLVGNPYPSTIDAETFLTVNSSSIENALYFWRKTNGASGSAYATYTLGGATTSTPTSAAPNGTIQVGQGFFVKAKSATTLNFTNAMRLTSASTQFFRTTSEIERNRIWLNLTNTSGVFSQMLVGYMTDATLDVDSLDGKYINDSPFALTSLINSEEYTIQGKPVPFDTNDTVPLGFKTNAAGNFTIGIDHVDGLFSNGQTIYLKDNLTNTAHNLSSGAYSFASDAGTYNSRFEIVYQSALVLPTFTANNVIVYSQNGEVTINSGKTPMNQVRIFDVRGRLLAEKNHINATETILTVGAQNQVLLVKIGTTEGSEVTKKIIQ